MRTLAAAGLLAAAAGGCGSGADPKATATPASTAQRRPGERVAALDRPLDRALRRGARRVGASAAGAAVVVRGRLVWAGAAGEAGRPDAVFSLASVTKPFIATLTLRRVEQGRLSLHDTVARWLGDAVPAEVGRARIRDLLGHTSGLADYFDDPAVQAADSDPRHRWTEPELLRAIHREAPPGSFAYRNSNYILLGAILRRVGGRRTGAQLRDEILRPLGLRHTSLDRDPALARRFAGGGRQDNDLWGELFSDGGMAGTAPDVARFFDALLVGERLLRPGSLRRMTAPGPNGTYGLGLGSAGLGRCRLWGHTGFYPGWTSEALTERRSGVTAVVLLHGAQRGDADAVLGRLGARLRRRGVLPC